MAKCTYYRLHDFDNNTMLDGLEIFKALTHLMPYDELDLGKDEVDSLDTSAKSAEQIKAEKKALKIKYYTGMTYYVRGMRVCAEGCVGCVMRDVLGMC